MKVLVVAQQGQIRDALEKQLSIRNRSFSSIGPELYGSDNSTAGNALVSLPAGVDVVVNALSLETLQQRPDDDSLAQLSRLVQICAKRSVPLILLSGTQVFDGLDGGVHRETDAVVPMSRLGQQLVEMENTVRDSHAEHIILRAGPLFSAVGDNLLTELLPLLKRGGALSLSDGDESCPIHVSDLARVISAMIDQLSCGAGAWGTYHYASADYVSRFKFAEAVLSVAEPYLASEVELTPQSEAAEDSGWRCPLLNCEKILNTFGIKQLPWRTFLAPTLRNYFEPDAGSEETVLNQSIQRVQKENFDG